jgi:hypothetical protein
VTDWPKDLPAPGVCFLCQASPEVVGLWEASADVYPLLVAALAGRGFGLPAPGKRRLVAYGLCGSCARRPGSLERVEDRMLAGSEQPN